MTDSDASYRAAWLAYWGRGGWTPGQLAESTANLNRLAAEVRELRAENADLRAEVAMVREQLRKHALESQP